MKRTSELEQNYNEWVSKNKKILSIYDSDPKTYKKLFTSLLINNQNDTNWINNLSLEECSKINLNLNENYDASIPINELISLNAVEHKNIDDEENEDIYLNMIIEASEVDTFDFLKKIIKKYYLLMQFIKDACYHNNYEKFNDYGNTLKDYIKKMLFPYKELVDSENITFNIYIVNLSDNLNTKVAMNEFDILRDESMIKVLFQTNLDLSNMYIRCANCAWPYVNASEELNIFVEENNKCTKYEVSSKKIKGYLVNISAKSIHDLFIKYREGLFSSNIRYFTKKGKGAKDVNIGIKNTIVNGGEMFFFLNNGITIVTSKIQFSSTDEEKISLDKFSIVNGGQTTVLLGENNINSDFPVPCKILEIDIDISEKLKKTNECKYDENLNYWFSITKDISYALNSQKPVSKKDLITNDSRVLGLKGWINSLYSTNKEKYSFLITKQGEDGFKTDKTNLVKFENYLIIISCFFFQLPGMAKNQKSKLYGDYWLEFSLGKDKESSSFNKFLNSEQLRQICNVKDKIKKIIKRINLSMTKQLEKYTPMQIEQIKLLGHCNNFILSIIGLTWQWTIEPEIQHNGLSKMKFKDFHLKKWHYVGRRIFKENISDDALEHFIKWICEFIYSSYKQYLKDSPIDVVTGYRNFTISDDYYFEYVAKKILNINKKEWLSKFADILEDEY